MIPLMEMEIDSCEAVLHLHAVQDIMKKHTMNVAARGDFVLSRTPDEEFLCTGEVDENE
jgi:hypothetical protein